MKDKIDNEYIRDGVKLAGWQTTRLGNQRVKVFIPWEEHIVKDIGYINYQHVIDALVAQLKSQVDETKWKLHEYPDQTIICYENDEHYTVHKGEGRAMNSLKAILDSRVLVMT